MSDRNDIDVTLPSVMAAPPGKYRTAGLVLTVVFHPSTARIGETATVPRQHGRSPWIIGRQRPFFRGPGEEAGCPLEDRHLSRRALQLDYTGKHAVIRRLAGSSRCQVGGVELHDSVELGQAQLRQGVPLMLGHRVVLLLRLAETVDTTPPGQDAGGLLRGSSAYLQGLRKQVARLGSSDTDVLIRGETGTGKELVAAAIHATSRRAQAALVSVNMAAIPAELAPAALFGSARGAFTGADRATPGYFQQAQDGTLFLDEVGDTPAAIQPQLLRALQQREIQTVGGPVRRVDLRVISATDADLEGEHCNFSAALRYRLEACEVQLLPLREHPEDIGELLLHFLATCATEAGRVRWLPHEESEAPEIAAWADLFHRFVSYQWPGNVRELANFAQQVVVASERQLMLPDKLVADLRQAQAGQRESISREPAAPARRKMQDVDKAEFEAAMQANCFEAAPAARQMGVSRQSVYRRIDATPGYRLANQIPREEVERVLAENDGDHSESALVLRVSLSGLRARLRDLEMEY